MLQVVKKFFTQNLGLKLGALILALIFWFYIVDELNKGSEEERQFLKRVLPAGGVVAKKLTIKPIFVGRPRKGYIIDDKNIVIIPEYCIVVGTKELLGKIRFAYTTPVDIDGAHRTFTKSVALNPIAPGIFTEETLVQVTVSVEKEGP